MTLTLACNAVQDTTYVVPGAIVEKAKEEVKFIDAVLHLEVQFFATQEMSDLLKTYGRLLDLMHDAIHLLNSVPFPSHTAPGDPIGELLGLFTQEIASLQAKHKLVAQFAWLQQTKSKRSLIDAGGMLLKSLFGVATNSDLKTINEQVNLVEKALHNSNVALVQMRHDQAALMRHLSGLDETLQRADGLERSQQALSVLNHKLNVIYIKAKRIEHFLDFIIRLDEAIFTVVSASKVHSKPVLSRLLFPYSLFESINSKTERALNLQSVVPLTQADFLSFISSIRVFPGTSSYSLVLIIPYTRPMVWSLYKFHSLPTFGNEHEKARVTLDFKYPNFLTSGDLKTVTQLSDAELRLCISGMTSKPYLMCIYGHLQYQVPLTLHSAGTELLCQESITRFKSTNTCQFSLFSDEKTVSIRVDGRLYLSFSRPVEGVITCRDGSSRATLQPLTILKSFCSLQTDDVAMPSLTLLKDRATSPLVMREVPLNATVDLSVRTPGEGSPRITLKAPTLSPDVMKHIGISNALLEKANHLKVASRVSSSMSTLAIVVATIAIVILYCKFGRKPKRKLRTTIELTQVPSRLYPDVPGAPPMPATAPLIDERTMETQRSFSDEMLNSSND